jgi:GcrA cell cycle regulator
MELEHHQCRYPVDGEKERTLFCGNATGDDSPYCTYHHKLCHGHGTHSERNVDALLRRVA